MQAELHTAQGGGPPTCCPRLSCSSILLRTCRSCRCSLPPASSSSPLLPARATAPVAELCRASGGYSSCTPSALGSGTGRMALHTRKLMRSAPHTQTLQALQTPTGAFQGNAGDSHA